MFKQMYSWERKMYLWWNSLKIFMKSHLDQKYDQEVEISDSSELLKQILGDEVPEGVLWDRVTAAVLLTHTNRKTVKGKQWHIIIHSSWQEKTRMQSLSNTRKVKCVILKNVATKEITRLSKNETKEQGDDKQCYGADSRAHSPWKRRCGCRGNAEGCRPRLPEGVLYARCTPSDCPPRSPPPHTDGERDI